MKTDFANDNKIYLMPGELYVAKEPKILWTVLGSCVSAILYSRERKISGMCHAQLPEKKHYDYKCFDSCPEPCFNEAPDSNEFKYVTCSIKYLLKEFKKLGIPQESIEVFLFGGGKTIKSEKMTMNIGRENIEVARKTLKNLKLKIKKEDVGGNVGRTINYHTDSGEWEIKYVEIKNMN